MTALAVTLSDVQDAAMRIFKPGYIEETPLRDEPRLAEILGFRRLLIKDETAHPVGAFKLRGAYNHFLQLTDQQKERGVFAVSSGNHAQAVAYAARQFQVAATILMPSDAPKLKRDNTCSYGAHVITYERATADREDLGRRLASEGGLHPIHPYNDPITIAGQGTVGIEIHKQLEMRHIQPDVILVPCSGGGLAAGLALTRDLYAKAFDVRTAEPDRFDDMKRSLEAGTWIANDPAGQSACDALMAPTPGQNTLPILLQHGAKGLTASDADAFAAMFIASQYAAAPIGIRLEPSGGLALACAIRHRKQFGGQTVVVIASGANVDPDLYLSLLERGRGEAKRLLPALNF